MRSTTRRSPPAAPSHTEIVRHARPVPTPDVEGLLEGAVRRVDRRRVRAVLHVHRVCGAGLQDLVSAGRKDIEVTLVDEARWARHHIDHHQGSEGIIGGAGLYRSPGSRVPVRRHVLLDVLGHRGYLFAHQLATLGQTGTAKQLLGIDPRAVELELQPLHQLARYEAERYEHAPALGGRRDPPSGEVPRRQELVEGTARQVRREQVARLHRFDRRDLDVVPNVPLQDHGDARHRLAGQRR